MQAAALQQAQRKIQALILERETYVRLTVCLANLLRTPGQSVAIVDGHVGVKRADYDAVPKTYTVNVAEGALRAADAAPDSPPEVLLVVQVTKKPESNGHVLAPQAPRLVLPS